jgi:photosystem II stability/assembly factor-like uncharacterized protein
MIVRNQLSNLGIVLLAVVTASLMSAGPARAAADLMKMPAPMLPNAMAVHSVLMDLTAAGDRQVAVGEYGLILYSDDGGTSWQQAEVPTSITLTAVDFPTPDKGWAVGHDGVVLHTQDGGATWQIQLSGLEANQKAMAQVEAKLAEVAVALEAASEEQRSELEARLEEMELLLLDMSVPAEDKAPTPLMDVVFLDDQTGFVVGAFGMIIETKDGGRSWEPIVDRMNNIDGWHYYGIDKVQTNGEAVIFIAGEAGLLMRSSDRGATWRRLDDFFEGTFFGVVGAVDTPRVVAFGLGGKAFFSDDLGEVWQPVGKPDENHQSISGAAALADGKVMLTSNNGVIYRLDKDAHRASRLADQVPGSMAAASTSDGQLVVAGIMGIQKIDMTIQKEK